MTNFIQEIEEDLERQKLEDLWRRFGPFIVVGALVVVLATAGMTGWNSWRLHQGQKASHALIQILGKGGDKEKISSLEDFAAKNSGATQATFAQLHAAGLAAEAGDKDKAVKIYGAIAADNKADPAFRQLAELLSIQMQLDTGNAAMLQKKLQPLLADNAPWRHVATEYAAFLALRSGDRAKAKQYFTELSRDPTTPPTISARTTTLLRALDE